MKSLGRPTINPQCWKPLLHIIPLISCHVSTMDSLVKAQMSPKKYFNTFNTLILHHPPLSAAENNENPDRFQTANIANC